MLAGDVEEAICTHAFFYSIWRKYGVLPERFNLDSKQPSVLFYPLRPELAESTYLLYQATKNPFYLHVGTQLLQDLEEHTRTRWAEVTGPGRGCCALIVFLSDSMSVCLSVVGYLQLWLCYCPQCAGYVSGGQNGELLPQ